MDPQIKKGFLEACVLKSIEKEDSYGYKIVSDLSDVVEISESTLYPILKRLEQAGSLTTYSQEFNGRLRKYYHITKSGKEKISDFNHSVKQIEKIVNYVGGKQK